MDRPNDDSDCGDGVHSARVLDVIEKLMFEQSPGVVPQSLLGQALSYLRTWPKLIRHVENGDWPISNNSCENPIRPFCLGRRGWLFADTVDGANASANLYALVETCKAQWYRPLSIPHLAVPTSTISEDRRPLRHAPTPEDARRSPPLTPCRYHTLRTSPKHALRGLVPGPHTNRPHMRSSRRFRKTTPMRVESNSVNAFKPTNNSHLTTLDFGVFAVVGYRKNDAIFKQGSGEPIADSAYGAVVIGGEDSVKEKVRAAGSDAVIRHVAPFITAIFCNND